MAEWDQLTANSLTTKAVEKQYRGAYWNDMICDVYVELECAQLPKQDFFGAIEQHDVGGLELSSVKTDPHQVIRTPKQIAKSVNDYFLISMQIEGSCHIHQDGRDAILQPGDFALYDSTRPYSLLFPNAISQIVMKMPRATLKQRISLPETLTATRISGDKGIGKIVGRLIVSLERQAMGLSPVTHQPIAENTLGLLATALNDQVGVKSFNQSEVKRAQLQRIKLYILDHLCESDLSVETISGAHRISPRYLHILFESEQSTVTRWIWEQRLIHAKKELCDPRQLGKTITQICYRWGFNDTAHFSRSYKRRFGYSPRAERSRTIGGKGANPSIVKENSSILE